MPPSTYHTNATLASGCGACHVSAILPEHERYGLTCATCHSSTAANVILAISTGNSNCSACHTYSTSSPQAHCYDCHSATGAGAPNTWNGRNVQVQFALTSSHSTLATTSGSRTDTYPPSLPFSQTTAAEFGADTFGNTTITAVAGGEVALARDLTAPGPGLQPGLVFANMGGTTNFDQFKMPDNAWNGANTALFTPAAATNSGTGASSFKLPEDNSIYIVRDTFSRYTPPANPASDSWAAATGNLSTIVRAQTSAGCDTAVNATGTTGQVVYMTRMGNATPIYWQSYSGTATSGSTAFTRAGTAQQIGQGSAIAFSPNTNRLFVIWKNGSSNASGTLDYGTGSRTAMTFTAGPQVTQSGTTSVWNRMTVVTTQSADTLYTLGPNTTGAIRLQVFGNLGTTPSLVASVAVPAAWTTVGDGMDLEYNRADGYLYASRGGSTAGFARILVPANPDQAASWTGAAWEPLNTIRTWTAGTTISFADANPLPAFTYYGAGTLVSPVFDITSGATNWGTLAFTFNKPALSSFSVMVQGSADGLAWTTLDPGASASPVDLGGVNATLYPKLRLTAAFTGGDLTSATAGTPVLSDWSVTAVKTASLQANGTMSCISCHNHDNVTTGGPNAWAPGRTSNPLNTLQPWTGSTTAFCLTCHTGTLATPFSAAAVNTPTQLIPYRISFRGTIAPFFTGWSKTIPGLDYAGSAHAFTGDYSRISMSQTTSSAFAADASSQTTVTNVSGGEVKLAQNLDSQYTTQPPYQHLVIARPTGANVDQFKPSENAWNGNNSANFTPTNAPGSGASGGTSYMLGGKLYFTQGGNATQWAFNPPTGGATVSSWTASTLPTTTGDGSDVTVNTNDTVMYVSRAGGSSKIAWRDYVTTTTVGVISFCPTSTAVQQNLGRGSAMAYAPLADKLFVLYKNGSTAPSDGKIYSLSAPGRSNTGTGTVFTPMASAVASATSNTRYRMVVANIIGTEYLFTFGGKASNATTGNDLTVVSNLAGTPSVACTVSAPSTWTALGADGTELEYDATDNYLYATYPGQTGGFARISVPADPTNRAYWGDWEILNTVRSLGTGGALGFLDLTPPSYLPFRYFGTGTITSPAIDYWANASKWGTVSWTGLTPASTSIKMVVSGSTDNGSTWSEITSGSTSPLDLSAATTVAWPKIKVQAVLGTTDVNNVAATPQLNDWTVTSLVPAAALVPVGCQTCHDPHGSENKTLIAYSPINGSTPSRVNTTGVGEEKICYKCHGIGSGQGVDVQTPQSAVYNHPINKSNLHSDMEAVTVFANASTRHSECSDCHDPHAAKAGVHDPNNSSAAGTALNGAVGMKPVAWPANGMAPPTVGGYAPFK
ncbi:MAG: cytochrome c3 family protein, partial [Actinomycetes bacterium]